MPSNPLRLVIAADMRVARIKSAWDEFDQFLKRQSAVEIAATDFGTGLDYAATLADLVVVLGGDGAILRACRQMGMHQRPIPANFGSTSPRFRTAIIVSSNI